MDELLKILEKNRSLQQILDNASKLNMPNWYVGAGGIAQTVWNVKHNFEPEFGIKDYDLVYYDASDTSAEAQDSFTRKGREIFQNIVTPVEIVNEARVHIWYAQEFGREIRPYVSVEDAISTWPTTATSTGVRKEGDGSYAIFAPYGLDDLLNLVVRPNRMLITEEIYNKKIERWTKLWPNLKVISWNSKIA
jgi:hypothetical protein